MKHMTQFKQFLTAHPQGVGYDEKAKNKFGSYAQKFLEELSPFLHLSGAKVGWNKAGIAISGEVTLKGMFSEDQGAYICLSIPCVHGFMFRNIKALNDSSGGTNQWFSLDHFENPRELASFIRAKLNIK